MSSNVKYEKYILPLGAVVGGYFLLKHFGLLGPGASDLNKEGISTSTSSGINSSIQAAKAAGDFQTITDAQAAALASTIWAAGTSDPVDQSTIQNSIIQANTLTDYLLIAKAFGTKEAGGVACSMFGAFLSSTCQTYDLSSFARATLDAYHLGNVNGYFFDQGINFSI